MCTVYTYCGLMKPGVFCGLTKDNGGRSPVELTEDTGQSSADISECDDDSLSDCSSIKDVMCST